MKKHTNGVPPVPTVVASPGAERSEAERSEVKRSSVPGEATTGPDPEVVAKAQRRQFSADYKKRIFAEAEAALPKRAQEDRQRRSHDLEDPDGRGEEIPPPQLAPTTRGSLRRTTIRRRNASAGN